VNNIYNTGTKYFHANSTGDDSQATGLDSVAIGMGAVASHDGSIALGANSLADGSTLGNQAYLVGGTATGEVNIGDRRITGLSAGAEDTDAVNVAQLKAAAGGVADTPITFAGNSGSVDKKLGETFTIEGVGSTAGTYSGNNLKTEVDANGNLQLLMAEAPKFGDVTINADGSGKITGLTAGTDATDAVNVSQLTSATEN
ncbi:hypothetical protein N5C80_30550, partial [Pseudomonas nicosulfuronedens]|nr:hypothetical protein [Pseudomonas nicosulfuronedens]MDH2030910.1 hypothetical protein [Pseudomonas nicosulfuronedens]